MLGSKAKERERIILIHLYRNRPVNFNFVEMAQHTKIRVGIPEAFHDLSEYGYIELHSDFSILDALKGLLNQVENDGEPGLGLPRFRITEKGIKYIERTEFKK